MNIRKNMDYREMYAALGQIIAVRTSQLLLQLRI